MKNFSCLTAAAAALALSLSITSPASAAYPERPVTIVVPFAAGGAADIIARVLAQEISPKLGQPVIIENRGGAGGSIGAAAVAKAPNDGLTLLFVAAGHAGMGALYPKLSFDPIKDFAPIIGIGTAPIGIAVNAESSYRTIQDLVAAAKANPGKLSCAGGGGGATVTNLAFELLKSEMNLKIEPIAYKGSAPALTALLSKEIDCDSDALAAMMGMVNGGKVRILAVTTEKRTPLLKDVPTLSETVLPGFAASVWYGILAPKETPKPIVDRLNKEFKEAIDQPAVQERFKQLTVESTGSPPAVFGKFVADEAKRWGGVIEKLGLKPE